MEKCDPDHCLIKVDSDDEIGESAQAFNELVMAQSLSLKTQAALRSFTEMLASQLEVDALTDRALQRLLKHVNAPAGAILIESDGELRVSASHGVRTPAALIESDHVRRALRTETLQRVAIPHHVVVEGILADFRPHEIVADPILYKDILLGVIVLASSAGFTDDEQIRLHLFRQGLALALNNALTYDRLQRLAALDPLTGAYNRRFGLARLHEEFGRAVRSTAPLGIIMLDIDHFKHVNDAYGHLAGDRVLSRVVRMARSAMREGDVMVRYGGEEFLAILPAASRDDAQQAAERIRRIVENAVMRDAGEPIRVTISAGIVAYPETDVESETDLVQRADQALYQAKETGRNRVIVV